jgi:hypothetical protein
MPLSPCRVIYGSGLQDLEIQKSYYFVDIGLIADKVSLFQSIGYPEKVEYSSPEAGGER